jgi:hypothetical protein
LLEEKTGDAEWRSGEARRGNDFVDHWEIAAEIGRCENANSGLRPPSATCQVERQPNQIYIVGSVRPQTCCKGLVLASVAGRY